MRKWILAAFGLALTGAGASAATIVNVTLGDPKGGNDYVLSADKTSAQAGSVEFDVTNLSKMMVHEMIVVAVGSKDETLPYDAKKDEVDEDKIKDLGEASDLPPGTKKALTLDLKPGVYRLICNQAGHYKGGMRADFTVTP